MQDGIPKFKKREKSTPLRRPARVLQGKRKRGPRRAPRAPGPPFFALQSKKNLREKKGILRGEAFCTGAGCPELLEGQRGCCRLRFAKGQGKKAGRAAQGPGTPHRGLAHRTGAWRTAQRAWHTAQRAWRTAQGPGAPHRGAWRTAQRAWRAAQGRGPAPPWRGRLPRRPRGGGPCGKGCGRGGKAGRGRVCRSREKGPRPGGARRRGAGAVRGGVRGRRAGERRGARGEAPALSPAGALAKERRAGLWRQAPGKSCARGDASGRKPPGGDSKALPPCGGSKKRAPVRGARTGALAAARPKGGRAQGKKGGHQRIRP